MTGSAREELERLVARYGIPPGPPSDTAFSRLHERCVARVQEGLLDACTVAAGVTIGDLQHATDPRVVEAFHLQFPHVDMSVLGDCSADQLPGYLSGIKGKLFEIIVRDRLNAGEAVGDLLLAPGQTAALAAASNQAGWDLQILDERGVVDLVQTKATESLRTVHEALERYPDIAVITPEAAALDPNLLDHALDGSLQDLAHTPLERFTDHIHPLLPLVIIAVTEGYAVITHRASLEEAAARALVRAGKNLVAGLAAGAAATAGAPAAAATGAALMTRFCIEIGANNLDVARAVATQLEIVERIATLQAARSI